MDDLKTFPNLEKDFPPTIAYPTNSAEYQSGISKINKLIQNSEVSRDLKQLLENSNIHLEILSKWQNPNGSCAYKKGENGAKNEIIICMFDAGKFPNGDELLTGVLAHELGHALDFSQRPQGTNSQYMDGCETFADMIGSKLAVEAGHDPRAFGDFMGSYYETHKQELDKKPMLYTPNGGYRKQNFDTAYQYNLEAKEHRKKELIMAKRGINSHTTLKQPQTEKTPKNFALISK